MTRKHHLGNHSNPTIRKEFLEKFKKLKKGFAESSSNGELIRNMEKMGFAYFDDNEKP